MESSHLADFPCPLSGMFTSKAGAAKTSLKLSFLEDTPAGGLTFQFINPGKEVEERQIVMDRLIGIIAQTKERMAAGGDETTSKAVKPVPAATPSRPASPAPSRFGGLTPEMIELRQAVLLKNPQLKMLHKELVMGKLVTESEFWSGREHLIDQEQLLRSQQPGRSSQLLDDRFGLKQTVNKSKDVGVGTGYGIAQKKAAQDASVGELKISVTKELQREIFEEFPIVQRIYAENVGVGEESMSEADFWRRYFRSQLWDRHRASARAGGGANSQAKADKVFDRYLEEPDDDIEPRNAPSRSVDMFLDLAATEEDHGETGNERDYTMQAGKQRATLPLIRRFNDHSNRLVGEDLDATTTEGDVRLLSEIELDDLQGPAQDQTFELDVGEGREYQQAGGETAEYDDEGAILEQRATVASWQPDLASAVRAVSSGQDVGKGRKAAEEALRTVTSGVTLQDSDQASIPDDIMAQVLTCHTAATEFLRQFWSAVLPNIPGQLSPASPEQKQNKARKMAGYLALTQNKVDAVVKTASEAKMGDPERVREVSPSERSESEPCSRPSLR